MNDVAGDVVLASTEHPPLRTDGWKGRAAVIGLDVVLAVTLVLALSGVQLVLSYHMAFAVMTVMAFIHATRPFVLRVAPGAILATLAVSIAVSDNVVDNDELYEIPIMVAMLACVFWAVRMIGRLFAQLAAQQQRLRNLHRSSQQELKEQLVLAQRLATNGRLSAGVAHNFRNSMTAILSLAERIEDSSEDAAVVGPATRIRGQVDGASELLSALSSAATASDEEDRCDLGAAVRDERAIVDMLAGPHVETEVVIESAEMVVPLSRSRVTQVLLNLAMNAHDALPDTGSISVRAESHGERARLTVVDNGVGMDETTKARAFEPFFTTRAEVGGSGLGLYMVQTIVEDVGGTVSVTSRPGDGTTVAIELPLVDGTGPFAHPTAADVQPDRFFGTESILVAEDDPVVRDQLVWILQTFGYSVHEVPDGAVALDVLEARPDIDLIVTDVAMPRVTGTELYEEVRGRGVDIPFLFVSAYEPGSRPHERLPAEADLLPKPFGRTQLLARVRGALD